jgi:hypothetical protein
MLAAFKKEPPEQVLWRDADKFLANGYAPARTPFGHGMPGGPWAIVYSAPGDADREAYGAQGVSILTGARPNPQFGLNAATASWCVSILVRTEHKGIAAAVDALIASRRVWREGVTSRFAPSRCTVGSLKRLHVFGLADGELAFNGRSGRFYTHPKLPGYMTVETRSANQQLVHSGVDLDVDNTPYHWHNGLDLTRVHRDQLPILGRDSADTLSREIEDLFEAHGASWS